MESSESHNGSRCAFGSETRRGGHCKIAVVGAGNILMRDEGVGVHVVERLEREGVPENVELLDAGVAVMNVMDDLSDFDRVIIIDATRGGEEPGAIYRYRLEDLAMEDFRNRHLASAHGITLVEALMLNKLAGDLPKDIILIGVEPANIGAGIGLSDVLKKKMSTIIKVLMEEFVAAGNARGFIGDSR